MRIGVVTTSYPREAGDPAGAFVAGFANWLAQRAEVEVIAAGPGAAELDGVKITRVSGRGIFYGGGAPDALAQAGPRKYLRALGFMSKLAWEIKRRAPKWDGAVSHWTLPCGLLVAACAPRLRHLAIAHSSDVTMLQRSKIGLLALRALTRRADLVYAAQHLVCDGAPGRVVPMGIDVDALSGGNRQRGRQRCNLSGVTALFLGRLVPVKGLDLLFDALPPAMNLLVAGAGPMEASWRAQAEKLGGRVRFLGEVRGTAKADLLSAADILVVPSRQLADGRSEGTPTVIFEGMAAGLAIVATRTGGAGAVIHPEENGLLVEPTSNALQQSLARLGADDALRTRLGQAAKQCAMVHDWSVVGPRLAGTIIDKL